MPLATNARGKIVRPSSRSRKGFAYKSYNFIDKDPVIHEVWDVVKGTSFAYIEEESGVSTTCLYSWFYGKTRKPQNATVRAVLRSVGFDLRVVKVADIEAPAASHLVSKPMTKVVNTVVRFARKR
jgi:DNA-binding phage protein